MLLQQHDVLFFSPFFWEGGPLLKARCSYFPADALCRNVWLTAGRSALHVGVRSALADITLVAFSFARAGQCNCQPQLAGAALVFLSRATPMSHDPLDGGQ